MGHYAHDTTVVDFVELPPKLTDPKRLNAIEMPEQKFWVISTAVHKSCNMRGGTENVYRCGMNRRNLPA
jgi:hypothetical protein